MRSLFVLSKILIVPLLLAVLLLGCEEDVTGVTGEDHPFTLYGILNPTADTQKVRVFPIDGKLEQASAAPIDAAVTSTDLQTGDVRNWRDSILSFADGTHGYLFWASFRPTGGHTYRIDVARSDGARSSAEVIVPNPLEAMAPIIADSDHVTLPLVLGTPSSLLKQFDIEYRVRYGLQAHEIDSLNYSYEKDVYVSGGVFRLDLSLSDLYDQVLDSLILNQHYNPTYNPFLKRILVKALVTHAGWIPPAGGFDPEVLIEPGTFSNVQNGFGFVGSGYYIETEIVPSEDALATAGFSLIELPIPPPPEHPPPPPEK